MCKKEKMESDNIYLLRFYSFLLLSLFILLRTTNKFYITKKKKKKIKHKTKKKKEKEKTSQDRKEQACGTTHRREEGS